MGSSPFPSVSQSPCLLLSVHLEFHSVSSGTEGPQLDQALGAAYFCDCRGAGDEEPCHQHSPAEWEIDSEHFGDKANSKPADQITGFFPGRGLVTEIPVGTNFSCRVCNYRKNREQPAIPLFIISSRKDLLSAYCMQGAELQTVKDDSDKLPPRSRHSGVKRGLKPPSAAPAQFRACPGSHEQDDLKDLGIQMEGVTFLWGLGKPSRMWKQLSEVLECGQNFNYWKRRPGEGWNRVKGMDRDAATDNAQGPDASANQYASFGQKESHISKVRWPAQCHRRPGPCDSRAMTSFCIATSCWPPRLLLVERAAPPTSPKPSLKGCTPV